MHFTFNETKYILLNPLPKVTLGDVYEAADLNPPSKIRNNWKEKAFNIDIRYSAGSEGQEMTLAPGKTVELPEQVANEVYDNRLKQIGLACISSEDSEDVAKQKVLEALSRAADHYQTLGTVQINKLMAKRNHTPEHVEQFKDSIYGTFLASRQKEKMIRDEIKKVRSRKTSGDKATAAA